MAPKQNKPEAYHQIPSQEVDDPEASTSENSTLIHEQLRDCEDSEIETHNSSHPSSFTSPLSESHNVFPIEEAPTIVDNEPHLNPTSNHNQDQTATLPVTTDGVFANIPAKPTPDTNKIENLPTYEEASRDSAPTYFGTTTLLAPIGDEFFVEGLPVGNIFSFLWSMLVSMCFQFIGFLLTYLLHTSHAAKNGSAAGLGFTLIQFGFYLRGKAYEDDPFGSPDSTGNPSVGNGDLHSVWISYFMMILGWLLVIRSTSEYIRVRKLEVTMLSTPESAV
ncbi:hypothetical protein K493DRAFT_9288 [Basidiobolus meristosporus CBS 931.73]|uniref:Metal homeostatis protein bsd2 n=1 Tax=Basidiobolus meristosporus CBS 931.73 TaxID=1314790 RepID=A0A1Y1Z9L5_9FUNG|nr:hypothetical protein K493DRAFT_9288 [Basidiobolus meristosporus CBS 931.73]|eukprot:ORY06952.1 hypothetical protein K493DRAFT_9288 [Basidiobolus meristosporus CBS 931.73]